MDTEKFQNSDSAETAQRREGTSRRKLLLAGAAALPVMVTIKSTSAHAAGLTAIPVGRGKGKGGGGGGGHDGGGYPDQTGVLGSIACIQHLQMPEYCDQAVDDVCRKKGLDYSDWCRRQSTTYYPKSSYHHSNYQPSGNGAVKAQPAGYQLVGGGRHGQDDKRKEDHDRNCQDVWGFFYDNGKSHFYRDCKFDVSDDRHCTYVQICMSTACWNSISTAMDIQKSGSGKYWS
jgi:hypothetical protein